MASYDDVYSQIGKAANSYNSPDYQNYDWLQNSTQSIYDTMSPSTQYQKAGVNQYYNNSQRGLQESLAGKGLLRSGQYMRGLMGNEQNRNYALQGVDANAWDTARNQAMESANLALNERNQLVGQQQTAAQQLASLVDSQNTYGLNQQALQESIAARLAQNEISNRSLDETVAARMAQNALQEGELVGEYGGRQTLAAQNLANQLALQEASLTGTYNGQDTLEREAALSSIAAAILSSYMQGTDTYTLPSGVSSWIGKLFAQ